MVHPSSRRLLSCHARFILWSDSQQTSQGFGSASAGSDGVAGCWEWASVSDWRRGGGVENSGVGLRESRSLRSWHRVFRGGVPDAEPGLSSMLVCGWVAHTGVPNSNSIWAVSLSLSRWCCHCLQAQGSLVLHLQHLPHHEEAGVHLCTRGRERCRSSMAKNILGPEEHQRGIKGQKKCRQVYPAKTSRELKLNHATVSKMCSVQGLGSLVCCALQGGLGCGCDSVGNREYILGRYWTAEKWLGQTLDLSQTNHILVSTWFEEWMYGTFLGWSWTAQLSQLQGRLFTADFAKLAPPSYRLYQVTIEHKAAQSWFKREGPK